MKSSIFLAMVALWLGGSAWANPPNTIILDGRPTEYDGADLRGTIAEGPAWVGNVITNLYVTWDETYLYIALQGWENGNKLAVLLDVDPEAGTGATTTTNWVNVEPSYIKYNCVGWRASDIAAEAFGLDYMFASEGFYNNILRITYDGDATPDTNTVEVLFDEGNGGSPRGTAVDMAVQADDTACDLKGFEVRIPWASLYNSSRFGAVDPGKVVPNGAQLRLFANLHNNDPAISYSSSNAIPSQTSVAGGWDAGTLFTADYITLAVDQDNDGMPDLGVGDVNAPFLRAVAGAAGGRTVYARFNETVTAGTATNPANWQVDESTPDSVIQTGDTTVFLNLTNDLPAAGTLVRVAANNVEDAATNSKPTYLCLFPVASGLSTSVTVRFVLNTASGLGLTPGASAFHINGSAEPLEWGYPPATSSPLASISTTQYYRDVTFPPGTATQVFYKYSGKLNNTGTNNFEAIRLQNYADASRWLNIPTDGSSLVVTDYLGAAAHPWRDPGDETTNHYAALYTDARRGDAGVRQRTTVTFQLDLSGRDLFGVTRVLLVGGDPLRGFNYKSTNPTNVNVGVSDWPGNTAIVGWDIGGIELVDDGTLGDVTAGDGIYSRLWSFTTNGLDSALVANPFNLVGGSDSDLPYAGDWANRRSPRSFAYKFAVVFDNETALLDPDSNIEMYLGTAETNMVLGPRAWANGALPLRPASNPPQLVRVVPDGSGATVLFTNAYGEAQHGVQFSTNLGSGWLDYGQMASGSGGKWTVVVANVSSPGFFRLYSGAKPFQGVYWEPNPLPDTGGTMRIYYRQHSRGLAGDRNVQIAGNFPASGWGPVPMTFVGDGTWIYDLVVDTNTFTNPNIEFKPRNLAGSVWEGFGGGGENYRAYRGTLRSTWSPNSPTNGGLVTITYDQAGGPLAAATNINAHSGFDEPWTDIATRTMTNIGGTVWELSVVVPTNASLSVNWVFNNVGSGTTTNWDSEGGAGRVWRAFINK